MTTFSLRVPGPAFLFLDPDQCPPEQGTRPATIQSGLREWWDRLCDDRSGAYFFF